MADPKELAATATGLCLNLDDFAPEWVTIQTILVLVSTGLAVFDTVTDWKVVLDFKDDGFKNPLLPPDEDWLRAWLVFASIGTFLTVISVVQDGHSLLHSMNESCKRHCCEPAQRSNHYELEDIRHPRRRNKKESKDDDDDDDDIDDPCSSCYHCGCNVATRNETLGAITLWFQDVPMLTLSVLFAFSQQYCKTPEAKDVTSTLFDVGISALAASIAGLWRTLRSLIRIYHSVGVRIKSKNCCLRICLPKKSGDVVYPPNSRVQWCIFPFFVGLMMQLVAIIVASGTAWFIWNSYVQLKTLTNFDDTLGIYRSESGRRLFDISGTIIPPNGSFFDLEMIPRSELEARDADVFCLSEFEYRSEDHQIYFNVVQLFVVSNDGRFCRTSAALDNTPNNCTSFYSSIYYASANPHTGETEPFCLLGDIFFDAGPVVDLGMDVDRHINRTGFPKNNDPETLLILYLFDPADPLWLEVQYIMDAPSQTLNLNYTFKDLATEENVTCSITFLYDTIRNRISFNYRDITRLSDTSCSTCSSALSPGPNCRQFHRNLFYAHWREDNIIVPYTSCSTLTRRKLVPFHDRNILVPCHSPCG